MECLDRLDLAVRKFWIGLSTRIGIRKTGLMQLRQEIRACEYEDVRVMWELLRKGNGVGSDGRYSQMTTTTTQQQREGTRHVWPVVRWVARAPRRLCSSF